MTMNKSVQEAKRKIRQRKTWEPILAVVKPKHSQLTHHRKHKEYALEVDDFLALEPPEHAAHCVALLQLPNLY